jgi:hypothetical protein
LAHCIRLIFLSDTVILWKSKLQKPLELSGSEAEYYDMSEAANDVKFVAMIIEAFRYRNRVTDHYVL